MTLTTELTELLGVRYPILNAPMANRAGGELAAAVTAAGGFGMIGAGRTGTTEFVETACAQARAAGLYGVGMMTWSIRENRALFDAVLAEQPTVIALSFGDIGALGAEVHAAGALLTAQVNTFEDYRRAAADGVDFVIAQGGEAGGHTGQTATLVLAQQILEADPSVPVIVAGGIATGRALAAMLTLGAAGVVVGTAFLTAAEAETPDWARAKLVDATAADTEYTSVFDRAQAQPWPARWGGRALVNDFLREHRDADDETLRGAFVPSPESSPVYAGEAVAMVRQARRPAAEIIDELVAGALARLA